MAHCTAHRQAQPDRGRGLNPVDPVLEAVLISDRTPFAGGHVAAIESGGDQLREARLGQQIPGQLLDGEPVKRHVRIECVDNPVSIGPDRAFVVEVQAVGVSVAGGIEPDSAHVLTVTSGSQQPVHHAPVASGPRVRQEAVDLVDGGWEPGEIESDSTNQSLA